MDYGFENLTDKEWDKLANWIKDNTDGCINSSFEGKSLKECMKFY